MILYHGSSSILQRPTFGAGNPHNDYGLGFYCTESLALAQEWACTDGGNGFANKYEIDVDQLEICHLRAPQYHILNWLAILLKNRQFTIASGLPSQAKEYIIKEFLPDCASADIIIGYRADDSYFSFAKAFLNGTISLSQLSEAMKYGNLGEQVVLMSRKAFGQLKYLESLPADVNVHGVLREQRDQDARRRYVELRQASGVSDGVYVIDILRNQWKNDDPRLR